MPAIPGTQPLLLLGPMLRHVDPVSATIWVETDRPCEVSVLGRTARTFCAHGHHYALVVVEDLEPGSTTAYEVHLDGEQVWPQPHSAFPPSRIRTVGRPGPFRIAFGSCRYATPATVDVRDDIPPDALDSYARLIADTPEDEWPDAMVLLGDQIYADELTPGTENWLALRRKLDPGIGAQASDFEEYTRLYAESWGDPQVRWLMSTIPSSMVFDDHEMIDDWNTSSAWRAEVTPTEWWKKRICGGLTSYWIYQHLGNLSPRELSGNDTWQAISGRDDGSDDAGPMLDEMARVADQEPESVRWSYVRHWGSARLIMIDSRAGRVLAENDRKMLDDDEFDWVDAAIQTAVEDGVDHLLVGTSLPWLLPHAVHHIERWNETLAARHVGRPLGKAAEKLRQAADLEHWAAFGQSFERLGRSLLAAARGDLGAPPATALVLSGDVHHAYAAELTRPTGLRTRIHQLTVSPLHNQAPHAIEIGFKVGWSRWARALTRGIGALARVGGSQLRWEKEAGPFFGNELGELVLDGRDARFRLFATSWDDAGRPLFEQVLDAELA